MLIEIEEAFKDVLDGNSSWHDIRANTGLPEERCKEIEATYLKLSNHMRIKEAAISVDGEIFTGPSHSRILLSNTEHFERLDNGEKGFVTECGLFVTRRAAAQIALKSGQVKELRHPSHGLFSDELF